MISSNSYLELIISIIATLVVLSILIQILQECYKYLTSLQARAFKCFLRDAFNIGKKEFEKLIVKEFSVAGPFQNKLSKPSPKILPLEKEQFKTAVQRELPEKENLIKSIETGFDQLIKNFDYSYSRRNLRITFIIALIVTFFFNLPIQNIYEKQNSLSTNQLADLTEKVISIKSNLKNLSENGAESSDNNVKLEYDSLITKVNKLVSEDVYEVQFADFIAGKDFQNTWDFIVYIFGCILTSILICFGAPFWNDILGALTSFKKRK